MAFKNLGICLVALMCTTTLQACSAADGDSGGSPYSSACPTGQVRCANECVSLSSDAVHCGACGHGCAANEVCSNSSCTSECASGLAQCGQSCVDTATDLQHCGGCDLPCSGTCTGGMCTPAAGGSGGGSGGTGGSNTGGTGGSNTGGTGGSNTGGTGGTTSSCVGAGPLFAEFTDPQCTDGQYCEVLPDVSVSIAGWVSQLEPEPPASQATPIALEMLDATWPFASDILRNDLSCADTYMTGSGWGWYNNVGLAVHECGHMWDLDWQQGWTYHMSKDHHLAIPDNDYFPRAEIFNDQYSAAIPDAAANDYFKPGEATSDQGIQTMFDEWAQYIHSVALSYLFCRDLPFDDLKDFDMGFMLHFAWAAPRYFVWAENHHPGDFANMMGDANVREAMLALWGQTMLYYDAFSAHPEWTPSATETQYFDAMRHPDLLDMVDRIREAHGCPGIYP